MIIYGTGSKNLGTKKLQGAKCQNCESTDMYVQAISRYVDIFWIPIFPFSKKMFSICNHCKQTLTKKEMSQQLKDKVELEKSSFSTPFYLFIGLAIIVTFIGWVISIGMQSPA